jgi:hypothetical protein
MSPEDALNELGPDYFVMDDVELDRGKVDHVVVGPSGVFVIETRSDHYEPRHLEKADRRASEVARKLGIPWATPVLCLTKRERGRIRRSGVDILPPDVIAAWIRAQRNPTLTVDQLQRWADV